MAHPKAKLTPEGRRIVVERVLVHGWSPAQVAEAMAVSRATVYKWLQRFQAEGEAGLMDRSSRPHSFPTALSPRDVRRVLRARRRLRLGPHQLAPRLGLARSTVYGVLRRHGLSRLDCLDRTSRAIIRYCRATPGELLHLDTKKLARIPAGGGHRKRGRSSLTKTHGAGYEYLHVAIDDCTRVAYVEILPDERGETAAGFLARAVGSFAARGVRVSSLLTDRAFCYTRSRVFKESCAGLGLRHHTTRP
jgi:transposase